MYHISHFILEHVCDQNSFFTFFFMNGIFESTIYKHLIDKVSKIPFWSIGEWNREKDATQVIEQKCATGAKFIEYSTLLLSLWPFIHKKYTPTYFDIL